MSRYFISGIGTGVGKTFFAAILTEALQADYWKPVQTGTLEDNDTASVKALVSNSKTNFHKESYTFKEPASPHLAAFLEGVEIHSSEIKTPVYNNHHLIIEGAGGLLVPLNTSEFVIDLAKTLDAEVILVCRNYLGCINHTLLSIDFLLRNNFKIKGLVLNGNFDPLVKASIVSYAPVPVLAEFPEIDRFDKEAVLRLTTTIDLQKFK